MKSLGKSVILTSVLVLLIVSLLAGCVKTGKTSSNSAANQPAATKDWKLVKSEDGKLSLKIPQDWTVKSAKELNLGTGKLFAVFGPADGKYTSNLQVSKETVTGSTLSAYISQFENNSKSDPATLELKVLEEGKISSKLGEAYRKKYSYKLSAQGDTFNLTFDAFYLKKGNDFYVIQMVTTDKLYGSVKKIFDNILATLNIK